VFAGNREPVARQRNDLTRVGDDLTVDHLIMPCVVHVPCQLYLLLAGVDAFQTFDEDDGDGKHVLKPGMAFPVVDPRGNPIMEAENHFAWY